MGLSSRFNSFASKSSEESRKVPYLVVDEISFERLFIQTFPWAKQVTPKAETLLFSLLRKVSRIPFPDPELPKSLDLEAYTRAMAILSQCGNGPMSEGARDDSYIGMRVRSTKDECRLLFQSLAFEYSELPTDSLNSNTEQVMRSKVGSSPDSESEEVDGYWYIDVSTENPYFTDLVDTLTTNQPYQKPLAPAARVFFKDIARRFTLPQTSLSRLRISRSDVLHLVEFLLAFQQAEATDREKSSMSAPSIEAKALDLFRKFANSEQTLLRWYEFGSIFAADEVVCLSLACISEY